MKSLGSLLRDIRFEKNIFQEELAKKIGVGQSYITQIETNRSRPSEKVLCKILDILSPSKKQTDEIIKAFVADKMGSNSIVFKIIDSDKSEVVPVKIPLRQVPVISWVHASKFDFDHVDQFTDDFIALPLSNNIQNVYALRIRGDCMENRFKEGDIIAVSPDIQPENNSYVIAASIADPSQAMLRQLKLYENNVKILHPLNPKYEDIMIDHTYKIIGVVVAATTIYV